VSFTLLLGLLLLAIEASRAFGGMVMEKRSGLFLVWALRDVVAALASAAFLCVFIHLAYMHFQRRIDRRKARWDYFCSRVREQLLNE